MTLHEHLICILAEEASEIIKDCSKSLRFGLDDRNVLEPGGPTNRERLIDELNDFQALVEMLEEAGIIPRHCIVPIKRKTKKEKVMRFLVYSEKVGTLQSSASAMIQCLNPVSGSSK